MNPPDDRDFMHEVEEAEAMATTSDCVSHDAKPIEIATEVPILHRRPLTVSEMESVKRDLAAPPHPLTEEVRAMIAISSQLRAERVRR